MPLLELISTYRRYHRKRISEGRMQHELLVEETKLILAAVCVIVVFVALAWYFTQ